MRHLQIASLNTVTPSLEDVFRHITARAGAPAVERVRAQCRLMLSTGFDGRHMRPI
jgi:hypothetical protein